MTEILSISIPTRNRAEYLFELLSCIKEQFERNPGLSEAIKIYLFDNDSTDNTKNQIQYLNWLKKECGLSALKPRKILTEYSYKLQRLNKPESFLSQLLRRLRIWR